MTRVSHCRDEQGYPTTFYIQFQSPVTVLNLQCPGILGKLETHSPQDEVTSSGSYHPRMRTEAAFLAKQES